MQFPVYLDHAATTPIAPEVAEAMAPYLSSRFGNPSSLHSVGAEAREGIEAARESVADALGADSDEIVFTGGGTEADNLAVKGACLAAYGKGRHVLVSAIEHHAVLDSARSLRVLGFDVETIPVDCTGRVSAEDVERRLRPDTALVSVMTANNEVGTIQPIEEIAAVCRARGALFHSDAVQAFGQLDLNVRRLGVDLLSISAHKVYGPKGVGALYVRRGVRIAPLLDGGGQERGLRGGTHNVAGIVGMHAAVRGLRRGQTEERARIAILRDRLVAAVLAETPGARLSGHPVDRLANNAHFCFPQIEGEALLLALDADGICASAGSACSSGSTEPSHVLMAMGVDRDVARGALRVTLGRGTTREQIDYAAGRIIVHVAELRALRRL
jgi:cysteine desulfurase